MCNRSRKKPASILQVPCPRCKAHTPEIPCCDGGDGKFIHSISGGGPDAQPIVCLQGYGAGAAIYYRMHCVDWLGTGLSGRPTFTAENTREAEEFFIDGLKSWYDQQGLGKMILVGHSLGGYLAALYAMKHPKDVKHLILVSPAAVASKPSESDITTPAVLQSMWTWQGNVFRFFKFLFANGITPQMVIRSLGPWGETFVGGYVRNRFREGVGIEEKESAALQSYFYHISTGKPSGEHALRHIFVPFAWGKDPLEGRLSELKVPLSFIYGVTDWMDPKAAQRVCQSIEGVSGPPASPADRSIRIIPEAGHFVFLDQPELFNAELFQLHQESSL